MKRSVVVLIHLAYWLAFTFLFAFAVFAYTIDTHDKNGIPIAYSITPYHVLLMLVMFVLPSVLCFYASYFFLFPRYFQQKKIFAMIGLGILFVIASVFIAIGIVFIMERIYLVGEVAPGLVLIMGVIPGIHALMGIVLRGFITSYNDIRVKEDLRRKNLETELALIKAHINPHFLFNTINNIDVLIKKDADKASDYLNKLSDILRYMLYETKTEKVPFSQEVKNIEKYLELQKIRTSNPDYIHYRIKGAEGNQWIAPMIFMPFIENAVKHASNKKTEKAIMISFDANDDRIVFECINAYSPGHVGKDINGGLGKNLAIKRLDLLYPGQYKLDINESAEVYTVKLVISLRRDIHLHHS